MQKVRAKTTTGPVRLKIKSKQSSSTQRTVRSGTKLMTNQGRDMAHKKGIKKIQMMKK